LTTVKSPAIDQAFNSKTSDKIKNRNNSNGATAFGASVRGLVDSNSVEQALPIIKLVDKEKLVTPK
jgi:hypothetical protein